MLGLAVAMLGGCHRQPPPVAKTAVPVIAPTQAAEPEPLPAQPVVLRRPGVEPLPAPVAVPKKRFNEALKQAQKAFAAGKLDERDMEAKPAPPEPSDMTLPNALTSKISIDALALYRGVLATDSENVRALHGVDAVASALLARAQAALAREDIVNAQRDADRLRLLQADAADLPILTAALDNGWHVAGLIERGQRFEQTGALIAPRAGNAAAVYRQALKLAPDSKAADAGLARVENIFIGKAAAEAQAGHYPQSDRLLAQAATVQPDSPTLHAGRARIDAIRQHAAALLLAQADAALASGDADRAERMLAQIERATPKSPESRDLRARIVLERNYGPFKPGQVFTDPLVSKAQSPEMIVVPIGDFRMGSRDDEPGHDANEIPQRRVEFKHGFAMSRTEITVEQFGRFVQAAHYKTDAERNGHSMVYDEAKGKLDARAGVNWRDDYAGKPADPQQPVMHVSWNDAQAYTIWLSKETAHLYRLPSEAEFEYGLRAGGNSAYPWPGTNPPNGIGNLAGVDASPSGRHWGDAFSGYTDGYWGPAPVAHYAANMFGLYDMIGNVSEWTQDCWHDGYRRAPDNGSAWVNPGCTQRVVRGGSWAASPEQSRSAYRAPADADSANARMGFRMVREL